MSNSLRPSKQYPPLSWDSPGKNTGVGCHFLLQGIFPTHRWNPGLLPCRQTLPTELQGKPKLTIDMLNYMSTSYQQWRVGVQSDYLLSEFSLQGQKYRHLLKAAHFLQNYDHNSLFPSDASICVQPDLCSRIQENSRGRKAHLLLYLCFMHRERNFQSDRYKISLHFMATSPHEYSQ